MKKVKGQIRFLYLGINIFKKRGDIELTIYQGRIKTIGQSFCGAGAAASTPWAAGVKES